MKIRKKEIAVLLAFVMLLGCLCNNPASLRAEEDTETAQPTEVEETKKGKIELLQEGSSNLGAGDTLQVKVHIYQMDVFAGLEGTLTYDKEVLELKEGAEFPVIPYPEVKDGTANWKASVTPSETVNADILKVEWNGEADPEDSDLAAAQNNGLLITIPFILKKPVTSQNISLTGVKVFTDKEHQDSIAADDIPPLSVTLNELEFKMPDVTGYEKILIPLNITKISAGVTGFTISVSFDKDKLVYDISSQSLGKDADGRISWQKIETGSDGDIQLKFISSEQLTEQDTGEIFNLAFKPKGTVSAAETTKVTLKVTAVDYAVSNPTPFYLSSTECTVTLSPLNFTLGDVSDDSQINLVDAVMVLKEIRGLNNPPFTEAQKRAADIDGDGQITLMDVYRIMQYYNGVIKTFSR